MKRICLLSLLPLFVACDCDQPYQSHPVYPDGNVTGPAYFDEQANYSVMIGIIGDTHVGYDGSLGGSPSYQIYTPIFNRLQATSTDYLLHLGDHVHTEAPASAWSTYAAIVAGFSFDVIPVPGNHDDMTEYLDLFPGRDCYYEQIRDVMFIMVDVTATVDRPPCGSYSVQQAMIDEAVAQGALFNVVAFHVPGISTGMRGTNECALSEIIRYSDEIDLVLNGHVHAYERFDYGGLPIIVTGGGGGFPHTMNVVTDWIPFRQHLYEGYNYVTMEIVSSEQDAVREVSLELKGKRLNHTVFDTLVLTKVVSLPDTGVGHRKGNLGDPDIREE